MKLYIEQKVFSWTDKFSVRDENGDVRYYVEGEFFTLGKKLHVYTPGGDEAAFIQQELMTFLPRYKVFAGALEVAEIVKKFTLFFPSYRVEGLGWEVEGQFMAHDYEITCGGQRIAAIRKEWMTWGDCYELDIDDSADEVIALAVVLAIDCVLASNNG